MRLANDSVFGRGAGVVSASTAGRSTALAGSAPGISPPTAPVLLHPPGPVAARGTVFTWTVNHHPFHPDVPTPYVIAVVELDDAVSDEPADRRVVGNVVGCDPDEVHIGMVVEVEAGQPPRFRPAAS